MMASRTDKRPGKTPILALIGGPHRRPNEVVDNGFKTSVSGATRRRSERPRAFRPAAALRLPPGLEPLPVHMLSDEEQYGLNNLI